MFLDLSQDKGPVVEAQMMLLLYLEPHRMIPLHLTYRTGISERTFPLFEELSWYNLGKFNIYFCMGNKLSAIGLLLAIHR
jgi:hypothetical protein